MALAPRAVFVYRHTELDELLATHGTFGQAVFFLSQRGQKIEEVERRDRLQKDALATSTAAVPMNWRQGSVERSDLARFSFAPEDVVVVVGQDGLVANAAKYLDGQTVIGVNPDKARNPGVLVPFRPHQVHSLLSLAVSSAAEAFTEERVMVEATTDDRQSVLALNEVFIGHPSHQSARYLISVGGDGPEPQSSSGMIIATGTGATGWARSIWEERGRDVPLPDPTEHRLCWFVREAWPSPATGIRLTAGLLDADASLSLTVESDRLVAFGDGIEEDAVPLRFSQVVKVQVATRKLRLLTG